MSTDKKPTEHFVPASPEVPVPQSAPVQSTQPVTQGRSTSVMAILGLVFAFLPFLSLLGLIFSIIGMSQTKDNKQGGRGLAIAGLIISSIFMILGLLWFVMIIVIGVTADKNTDSTYDSFNTSLSELSDETKVISGTVGSTVAADNFDLIVKDVQKAYTPVDSFYVPEDGKQYVMVLVQLTNRSSDSENFSDYDFKLRNSAGVEVSSTYISDVPTPLSYGSLASGGTVTGNIVFEVVKDSALTLVYTPNYFTNEVAEVKL